MRPVGEGSSRLVRRSFRCSSPLLIRYASYNLGVQALNLFLFLQRSVLFEDSSVVRAWVQALKLFLFLQRCVLFEDSSVVRAWVLPPCTLFSPLCWVLCFIDEWQRFSSSFGTIIRPKKH